MLCCSRGHPTCVVDARNGALHWWAPATSRSGTRCVTQGRPMAGRRQWCEGCPRHIHQKDHPKQRQFAMGLEILGEIRCSMCHGAFAGARECRMSRDPHMLFALRCSPCVFFSVCAAGGPRSSATCLKPGRCEPPNPTRIKALPGNLMARELAMREDHLQAEGGSKGPSILPSHPVTFSLDVAEMCLLIIDHGGCFVCLD